MHIFRYIIIERKIIRELETMNLRKNKTGTWEGLKGKGKEEKM